MKSIQRPAFLVLLLLTAAGVGYLAGDARSEDDKAKGKRGKGSAPFVQIASGKAKLKEGGKAIKVTLGKDIAGTGKISITDWFGAKAVSGQVNIENKADRKIHTAVSLILFDKDGKPLGCASQNMDADPKEATIWGGFVIKLPNDQLAKVRSYTYIWYEDDRPIGQR